MNQLHLHHHHLLIGKANVLLLLVERKKIHHLLVERMNQLHFLVESQVPNHLAVKKMRKRTNREKTKIIIISSFYI